MILSAMYLYAILFMGQPMNLWWVVGFAIFDMWMYSTVLDGIASVVHGPDDGSDGGEIVEEDEDSEWKY